MDGCPSKPIRRTTPILSYGCARSSPSQRTSTQAACIHRRVTGRCRMTTVPHAMRHSRRYILAQMCRPICKLTAPCYCDDSPSPHGAREYAVPSLAFSPNHVVVMERCGAARRSPARAPNLGATPSSRPVPTHCQAPRRHDGRSDVGGTDRRARGDGVGRRRLHAPRSLVSLRGRSGRYRLCRQSGGLDDQSLQR